MLVSIQDLRSIQERCEIGELVQRLDVSIDRLTVIWDTDTGSLRRIFKNLKQAISTRVDSFEIHDNVRDDVFTLAKDFNEYDSINIIFFQLSTYGGEQLIRIDFNPNTLKEFDGMKVWRQLMYFARLNSLRYDCLVLIWHLTFSTGLRSLICNILKVVLPIRSSMVEGAN